MNELPVPEVIYNDLLTGVLWWLGRGNQFEKILKRADGVNFVVGEMIEDGDLEPIGISKNGEKVWYLNGDFFSSTEESPYAKRLPRDEVTITYQVNEKLAERLPVLMAFKAVQVSPSSS
ncbi:hypothetical protein CCP3SC1_70045 [Gammaproteobacteria bacterium]